MTVESMLYLERGNQAGQENIVFKAETWILQARAGEKLRKTSGFTSLGF